MTSTDESYQALIKEHAGLIHWALYQALGRRFVDLKPDAEQEIALAIWDQFQKGKNIQHPTSYLYKVALRIGLKLKKKAMQEMATEDEILNREPAPSREEPRLEWLHWALDQLPQDYQRALRAYMMGFDHKEVAQLFQWTDSVARHRIYRGIEKLKSLKGTEYVGP